MLNLSASNYYTINNRNDQFPNRKTKVNDCTVVNRTFNSLKERFIKYVSSTPFTTFYEFYVFYIISKQTHKAYIRVYLITEINVILL